MKSASFNTERGSTPYLSALGAWALAFGCCVGWGAFIMPGTTFLPFAGPVGTALGLVLGAVIMLLIAANYHFLMNNCPENGGTYAFTRNSFGYDHGFLTAWFLMLTYMAIIWANASALPLLARTLFGGALQFGFHYEIAGWDVYLGELLLSILALGIAALLCLRRSLAVRAQIALAAALCVGVAVCFVAALSKGAVARPLTPAFSSERTPLAGTLIIFALAPWVYVGFESICHASEEARFPLKKSMGIMAAAIVAGAVAYILLSLLAVTALPEGCASWADYLTKLGSYQGTASQPAFFAAQTALGTAGSAILGLAALCAVCTGLIGCFIALSRLLRSLAKDGLLPGGLDATDANGVPRKAILLIFLVSVIFPFLGRTAIGWIVDVTTVGATIAYAITSAAAWKTARAEKQTRFVVTGVLGFVISILFVLEFLIPKLTAVKTLSTESYLILAVWGLLGIIFLRWQLSRDKKKRLGRSTFALVILMGLVVFTASVWMLQSMDAALAQGSDPLSVEQTLTGNFVLTICLIVLALVLLVGIYAYTQRRERQTEIEKAIAEEASHARTSFLSNMSHEIRTPMNAIIGLDSIVLKDPDLKPQTREQLETIGNSARHLLGLLNDILDLSLFSSGGMILKDEEFALQGFLQKLNASVNAKCADKGLHYECSIVGQVRDYYYGDEKKLAQALGNILGNAVKFTDAPGRVLLTVEQTEEDERRCELRFTVRDSGVGIDEDYIPKLFEPFTQEDMSNTSRYGGSGLGLAISKNYIDMMGGSIRVQSQKGVGSLFTVTVPLNRSERSFQLDRGGLLDRKLRAVVVDADPDSCDHARAVLRKIGVDADCYTDAWEAFGHIREAHRLGEPYGLVITDYKLPNLNGLELTRMIREFDAGKTAVIMLTGYNWDIIEETAAADGVDSVGAKPLFPDSLLKEIQTVLAKKEGREPDAKAEEQAPPIERVLSGRRVLMAEDIDLNADILEGILDMQGMQTERAVNGAAAVELFSAHPAGYYDAILMDIRMPVMDGLSATRAIRALDHADAKAIPIIAMTANVFDEDVRLSMEAGMNAHLSKPVEPELLYDTLAKQIAARL